MTNSEILLNIHRYLHNTNFFYARVIDQSNSVTVDTILTVTKKLSTISSLNPDRYPTHILLLKNDLLKILPSPRHPEHYVYKTELEKLFSECRARVKLPKQLKPNPYLL
ncbi:MAG: hypothetical protein HC906_16255 [Bacteroidales bacterium]|nr:hypothetical protein [Bacteroidales bacterium]